MARHKAWATETATNSAANIGRIIHGFHRGTTPNSTYRCNEFDGNHGPAYKERDPYKYGRDNR